MQSRLSSTKSCDSKLLLAAIMLAALPSVGLAADSTRLPLEFTVQCDDSTRTDATVMAIVAGFDPAKQPSRLREITDGMNEIVASQWEPDTPAKLWWLAAGATPKGKKRSFRLEAGTAPAGISVSVERDPARIQVKAGDAMLLSYNSAHVEPPAGIDPKYGRSGHIHPVWTPRGKMVTEQFPLDHAHQSGVFLAHTKSRFEGRDLNFWDIQGGKGRVRFKQFHSATSGPVFGEFRVEHEHVDQTVPGGKVAALETWDVRVWNRGNRKSAYWVWDITSSLRCAGSSPLELLKYHYGGMAIRGSGEWSGDKAHFVTSEDKGRIDGNHTRPIWCDLSGPVGGATAGIALLTHPDNMRYPEPLRIHPTMPYMVYAPSHLGDWEIRPGSVHVSRYRFVVHDGEISADILNRVAVDFSQPLLAKNQ
jgi:hypothetical protein